MEYKIHAGLGEWLGADMYEASAGFGGAVMCSGPLLIELNFLVLTCDARAFPPEQNSLEPELRLGGSRDEEQGGHLLRQARGTAAKLAGAVGKRRAQ